MALEESRTRWPMVAIIIVGAAGTWFVPFTQIRTTDFKLWTGPWFQHIVQVGRIGAFAHPFGNYTPPYLYLLSALTLFNGAADPQLLIKALSGVGAAWVAFAIYRLLVTLRAPRPIEAAAWAFLLPSVVLNVAVLGQADCFWVAPCLLAVRAGIRRETLAMMLWCGLAFSFKAQAIFIAPFALLVLIRSRAPWWHWTVPAITYAVAMLPAWLAGWNAGDLATVYLRQAQWKPPGGIYISNAPGFWAILGTLDESRAVRIEWAGYIVAALATLAFVRLLARRVLRPAQMLAATTLSAAIVPFLLPAMHERYFMLADVSAFAYAFAVRTMRASQIAVLTQFASVAAIYSFLSFHPLLPVAGACFAVAAMTLLIAELRLQQLDVATSTLPPPSGHLVNHDIAEVIINPRNADVHAEPVASRS